MACGFGADGLIAYMIDDGEDGQRLYKSTGITWNDRPAFLDLTIVTFRAAAVTLLGLENPQTMTPYGWADVVNKDGLVPFRKQCIFTVRDPFVAFIEPDERFYVKLEAGSPKNRLALVTRAFMLGRDDRTSAPVPLSTPTSPAPRHHHIHDRFHLLFIQQADPLPS